MFTANNENPGYSFFEVFTALLVGILIDAAVFAGVVFFFQPAAIVLLIVAGAHLVISIGLIVYRRGDLDTEDMRFLAFGFFYFLWKFVIHFLL